MVDVLHSVCIGKDFKDGEYVGCETRPSFNYEGNKTPLYCTKHKDDEMVDVVNKICSEELCDRYVKYDNLCLRCFYFYNPTDKRVKQIKIKEVEVVNFIKNEFKDLNFIFDKQLRGDKDCINLRPDILLHLNHHTIIIEIDEHQHKNYETGCDKVREHKIHEILDRNVIFIRFNPDNYMENKKTIKSCFQINLKLGYTIIPKSQEKNWNNRLQKLKKTLEECIERKTEKPIDKIYLYYDN
tara:strand:- start:43806 stop:44525 length:720 start_codon:yes stop_codon:yes gene_type:complete